MPATVYRCPCCGALLQLPHPGMAPASFKTQCPRCGCATTFTPAERPEAHDVFTFVVVCPRCGETAELESATPEPPPIPDCPHCSEATMECDACGYKGTVNARKGQTPWLPACPECGTKAVLPPASHPNYHQLLRAHQRFLYVRHLVTTGRLSEQC